MCVLSPVWLSETPWTVACQASLSMGFPRREYWSGLPFPSPGNLPDPGIEATYPALAGGFFTAEPPGKPTGIIRASDKNTDSGTSLPGFSSCFSFPGVLKLGRCLSSGCLNNIP